VFFDCLDSVAIELLHWSWLGSLGQSNPQIASPSRRETGGNNENENEN